MPKTREAITLDLEAARDLWKRLSPPNARRLIDAEPIDTLEEKSKRCDTREKREGEDRSFCALLFLGYFFDPARGRYLTGANQLVTQQAVKQATNTFSVKVENRFAATASQLVDKSIDLPEYEVIMRQQVTAAHTAAYVVGVGGLPRLTGDVLTAAQDVVAFHLDKLNGFAADVKRGDVTGEAIVARSRLYGASVAPTFEQGTSDTFKRIADSGVTVEERNILGDAEHCNAVGNMPGCYEESAKGWRPFGELSRPGLRRCLVRCKCRLERRIVQK